MFKRLAEMRDHKGFTVVEGLLILIVVGLLSGTGWYVWDSYNKSSDSYSNADQAGSSVAKYAKKKVADPTAIWKAYSSVKGVYSLKYPTTWVAATHPELCGQGILLLGPDSKSVGACGSENFGQISVVSVAGNHQTDYKMSSGYKDVTMQTGKVDGVSGLRSSGTASGQKNIFFEGALPDGTKVVKYVFYAKGRTYSATYAQTAVNKDVLSDFDLMVTKTLKFSS